MFEVPLVVGNGKLTITIRSPCVVARIASQTSQTELLSKTATNSLSTSHSGRTQACEVGGAKRRPCRSSTPASMAPSQAQAVPSARRMRQAYIPPPSPPTA